MSAQPVVLQTAALGTVLELGRVVNKSTEDTTVALVLALAMALEAATLSMVFTIAALASALACSIELGPATKDGMLDL